MKGMFRKKLAVFLVLTTLLTMMPATVFAAEVEPEGAEGEMESNEVEEDQTEGTEEETVSDETDDPLSLQLFAASYVFFTFELNTAAVAGTATYPGATVQVETTQYTSNDYFTSPSTSSAYMAYSGTTVKFVINYLATRSSNAGSGIGKVTGEFVVDADGDITSVTAKDVTGASVAASVSGSGSRSQKIKLTNPTATANLEWTTATSRRVQISPTPSDASFDLFDGRDDTRIPIYAIYVGNPAWALPVPITNGATNEVNYVVQRAGYETASGTIQVTRTGTSINTSSLTLVPDGSEASASLSTGVDPAILSVELKKQSTDYGITFSIKSVTAATVTMTMDGATLSPAESSKYKYIIPLVSADTVVDYEISAPDFKTVRGQLKLKPDGTVEDITDQAAKDGTVSYFFDAPAQQLSIEMLPSVIGTPSDTPGLYEAEVFGLLDNIFASDSTSVDTLLTGGVARGGRLEVTNPDPDYRTVITGVRVEGYASMSYNVLRVSTPITRYFTNEAPADVGEYMRVRDIVKYANENKKFSGENFQTYYDCVLYYMQNEAGYSNISSLDELDLDGLQILFSSLSMGVGNYTMDLTGYDGREGDIDYNHTGRGALRESEDRIQALALKLLNEYALYFSLDDTITGALPMSSSNISAFEGLQFNDYLKNTDANQAQVARMIDGIVLEAGGSYVFENISFSTLGDYLWNHFYINGLVFDFTLYFTMARVGIDGVVFEDANGNGTYDEGELLHEGVPVRLYAADNLTIPLDTTKTDSDGYYLFNNMNILQTGNYVVQIDLPDGKTVTILGTTGTGDDNVFTQNADGGTANSKTINYVVNTNARANAGLKSGDITNPKYTVTYDANGGTGRHQDTDLEYESSYTVRTREDTGISYSGYIFIGWNTRADGHGTAYAPGDRIIITGDIILYAQWRKTSTGGGSGGTNDGKINDTTDTDDTTNTIVSPPYTGGTGNIVPWATLLFISLTGAIYRLVAERRRRQCKAKHYISDTR